MCCSTYNKQWSEANNALVDLLEFEIPKEDRKQDKVFISLLTSITPSPNPVNPHFPYHLLCLSYTFIQHPFQLSRHLTCSHHLSLLFLQHPVSVGPSLLSQYPFLPSKLLTHFISIHPFTLNLHYSHFATAPRPTLSRFFKRPSIYSTLPLPT